MARDKSIQINIDKSDLPNYPNGRIKDNRGSGDGTPVNEKVYGDIHEFFSKLMRLAGIIYNGLPDNENQGYQLIEAMKALAGKNDFIYSLSGNTSYYSVPIKLGILKTNETLLLKAEVNSSTQNRIRGNDNTTKSITVLGSFKRGDYVRLISTTTGIILIPQVDVFNLNTGGASNGFLKGGSQAQEDAGSNNTVATTPRVNKVTFTKRVIGNQSRSYLASSSRNGLLSKELWTVLNNLGQSSIRNKGAFAGLEIRGSRGRLPVSGDITIAIAEVTNGSQVLCTMRNTMDNLSYVVKMYVETQGDMGQDNDIGVPSFKIISRTQFRVNLEEFISRTTQNLKIHFDIEQR